MIKCSKENKTHDCDVVCDTGKVAANQTLETVTSFTCGPESDYLWRQTREITPCSGRHILSRTFSLESLLKIC